MLAPANTPAPIIERLNSEISKALNSSDLKEELLGMGMEPTALSPERPAAYMKTEIDRWAQIEKISGAKAN